MSGICGVVGARGAAIDAGALETMTSRMRFRGPDRCLTWTRGPAGLGHTLLRTGDEDEPPQPFTIDGSAWIAADARIDDRERLAGDLRTRGIRCSPAASAPELILHAYACWGEDCPRHLLGDFAFAIWDVARAALFCARDHFGIKLLFHSHARDTFAFSNTLDALRAHPAVPGELDDAAVADFLLFDAPQDPVATAFRCVRRLPPAHCLTFRDGALSVRRYWSLPPDLGVEYGDRRDCPRRFTELLDSAVADRLGAARATVSMSGGLDSPTVAAAALRVARKSGRGLALQAHTLVYDRLVPDRERHYAGLASSALGIPIRYRGCDDYPLFGTDSARLRRFAEPLHDPEAQGAYDLMRDQAEHARVSLTGWDGDTILNESPKPYFRALLRAGRLLRLADGVARYAWSERRLMPRKAAEPGAREDLPIFPAWLDGDLERRLSLRERWHHVHNEPQPAHPLRPNAYRVFSWLDRWSNFFDSFDPGVSRLPLEVRHPFLDLRVVEFCLRLPTYPWCIRKQLLRDSLAGVVPDEVRLRPKTPLAANPALALLSREESRWVDHFIATPSLARYIDRKRIPPAWGAADPRETWVNLKPFSLNLWLQQNETTH